MGAAWYFPRIPAYNELHTTGNVLSNKGDPEIDDANKQLLICILD